MSEVSALDGSSTSEAEPIRARRLSILNADARPAPPHATAPGIEAELVDLRIRVMPRTPYDRLLCDVATVDAAERAIAAGADGLYLASFGDYGIDAIRSCTDVPVVGAGAAAIEQGAHHGRFAVVTVWPPMMRYLYDDRLAAVTGGDRCVAVHHLFADADIGASGAASSIHRRATSGDADVAALAADACRAVADSDGVDAVVLGCTCMSALAASVATKSPVPVIDPFATGYERAVDLIGTGGSTEAGARSPRTRYAGRVRRLVDGARSDRTDPPAEACGVCVPATSEV